MQQQTLSDVEEGAMSIDRPKGLLSFLYHVRYDEEIRERFHANSTSEMVRFALSGEAKKVLTEAGSDLHKGEETKKKHMEALALQLAAELAKNDYDIIW
jgi:hypothetical protein